MMYMRNVARGCYLLPNCFKMLIMLSAASLLLRHLFVNLWQIWGFSPALSISTDGMWNKMLV